MSQINLTHNGKTYTLEYNRLIARQMESQGFRYDEVAAKPNTMIPLLWEGAFAMHHRGIKRTEKEALYKEIPRRADFIAALTELYAETANTLFENENENEGNATWEISR